MPAEPVVAPNAEVPAITPVQSWMRRASSIAWVPGSVEQCLARLRFVAGKIAAGVDPDETLTWHDSDETFTLKAMFRTLGTSGLLVRDSGRRVPFLSPDAEVWLETGDTHHLISILHANVRFVGEILAELDEPRTHDQLREIANLRYGMQWNTLDQIRRRTSWLRAAGLIELWSNNNLVRTVAGENILERLDVVDPDEFLYGSLDSANERADLPEAGPVISTLLDELGQADLVKRKRSIGYIPGSDEVDALLQLVTFANPPAPRERLLAAYSDRFKISESSADTAFVTIRATGLIHQVGPDSFAATPAALEWIESDEPVNLVRIFHARFTAVGEILTLLDDTKSNSSISRELAKKYNLQEFVTNEVAQRLRLLHGAGLVDRMGHALYRVNSLGRAFAASLPMLNCEEIETGASEAAVQDFKSSGSGVQTSNVETWASTIIDIATDTTRHQEFEIQIANCFGYLGFDARHLGGPGGTDVILTAWLEPSVSQIVIVEAKTAGSGVVDERSISFEVLDEHQREHNADQVVVVGPSFGGRLPDRARRRGVKLLTAATLASWVQRQKSNPLSIARFVEALRREDDESLDDAWNEAQETRGVLRGVVSKLWECAHDPSHLAASDGALNARELWLLMRSDGLEAGLSEIEAALSLLASPLISAVRPSGRGNYVSAEDPRTIARRLQSYADHLNSARSSTSPAFRSSSRSNTVAVSSLQPVGMKQPTPDGAPGEGAPSLDLADVRRWAKEQGLHMSDRGRVAKSVIDKYLAAIATN